jgi:hypothetical protein
MSSQDEARRFADLIWRSYRLKFALLVGGLLCILLVSSALRNGRTAVDEINKRSMAARLNYLEDIKALAPQASTTIDNPLFFDPSAAEIADQTELRLYAVLRRAVPPQTASADPKQANAAARMTARADEVQRFIDERENAYNLEFGVSNLKSTIFVNALVVIDFWPLILISVLAAVSAVTMRQHAYEVMLSHTIQEADGNQQKAVQSAFSGFLAGELKPKKLGNDSVLLYRRSLIVLPEPLITLGLLSAVLYASIGLPATAMPSLFKSNSTVFGYHTLLIFCAGCLLLALRATKLYYGRIIREATGSEVFGRIGFYLAKATRFVKSLAVRGLAYRTTVLVLSAAALASMFLPWIGNWRLSGFQLFLPQKPIVPNSPIPFYKIDPALIREMRAQLAVALVFVGAMALSALWRNGRLLRAAVRSCRYISFLVCALISNIVVYLLLLAYSAQRTVLDSVLNLVLPTDSLTALQAPRGLPLVMMWPMYGFITFAACLLALSLIGMTHVNLERRTRRRTHP